MGIAGECACGFEAFGLRRTVRSDRAGGQDMVGNDHPASKCRVIQFCQPVGYESLCAAFVDGQPLITLGKHLHHDGFQPVIGLAEHQRAEPLVDRGGCWFDECIAGRFIFRLGSDAQADGGLACGDPDLRHSATNRK